MIPQLCHFIILGHWNTQNMPQYNTVEQGKNTEQILVHCGQPPGSSHYFPSSLLVPFYTFLLLKPRPLLGKMLHQLNPQKSNQFKQNQCD